MRTQQGAEHLQCSLTPWLRAGGYRQELWVPAKLETQVWFENLQTSAAAERGEASFFPCSLADFKRKEGKTRGCGGGGGGVLKTLVGYRGVED